MAKVRLPWRALRPLLLAGAVTATWLTLSSSAATADSGTDSGSLPGGVTSSLSAPLTEAVAPLLEPEAPAVASGGPASAAPPSAGLLQPVAGPLADTTDQLVARVPVVKSIVPPATVSAVTAPAAGAAGGVVAALVEATVPQLVETAPILEPVLQPVADLVTGTTVLPPAAPGLLEPANNLSPVVATESAPQQSFSGVPLPSLVEAGAASDAPGFISASSSVHAMLAGGTPVGSFRQAAAEQASPGTPVAEGPERLPLPALAVPGSGAGSGASPSGSSGAAAWLHDLEFNMPPSGTFRISGALGHVPSPVSFDPGSSPD